MKLSNRLSLRGESLSDVIVGVDYVGVKNIFGDVSNMSLGGVASMALDDAVFEAPIGTVIFFIAASVLLLGDASNGGNIIGDPGGSPGIIIIH